MNEAPRELQYVLLLFGLLVLPKMLQRYRVPSAITTLFLGLAFGAGLGIFLHDETVHLLSTFGIASLFLFAGLDVDGRALRRGARILIEHLAIVAATVAIATAVIVWLMPIGIRAAVLVALAIVTPSTGFILDSLSSLGVSKEESYWIRTKAIASELLALGVLFVTLQSTSVARLGLSAIALVAMAAFIPILLRFLADGVSRYAPNSEFAFLLIVAVIFAYATRQLGVYYLVGAFLVGVTARRLREQLPRLASDQNLHAVEVFASFFVPFYFFNAGLSINREALSWNTLWLGLAFAVVSIPLRTVLVILQRRARLAEHWRQGMRVAVPLIPTLVFTLVLAEILRERFGINNTLFGGLIAYAALTTIFPAMVLRTPREALDFDQDVVLAGAAPRYDDELFDLPATAVPDAATEPSSGAGLH
jgi:Kef-type K+ transport system membrane component KefB